MLRSMETSTSFTCILFLLAFLVSRATLPMERIWCLRRLLQCRQVSSLYLGALCQPVMLLAVFSLKTEGSIKQHAGPVQCILQWLHLVAQGPRCNTHRLCQQRLGGQQCYLANSAVTGNRASKFQVAAQNLLFAQRQLARLQYRESGLVGEAVSPRYRNCWQDNYGPLMAHASCCSCITHLCTNRI